MARDQLIIEQERDLQEISAKVLEGFVDDIRRIASEEIRDFKDELQKEFMEALKDNYAHYVNDLIDSLRGSFDSEITEKLLLGLLSEVMAGGQRKYSGKYLRGGAMSSEQFLRDLIQGVFSVLVKM